MQARRSRKSSPSSILYKGIHRDENGKQDGPSDLFTKWKVRKHLLDDLYIRFFRLAEERIAMGDHYGIVSFISNSSFLAGRSHPILRESIIQHFQDIWIDNLNGDKYKTGKVIPKGLPGAGTTDQSVFTTSQDARGIQVGVSITTMLKRPSPRKGRSKIHYRDFWGKAADKRAALLSSLVTAKRRRKGAPAEIQTPAGPRPYQDFPTSAERRWKLVPYDSVGGYEDWPSLEELFPTRYQGVNPNRGLEGSVVEMDQSILAARMRDYYSRLSFADLQRKHPVICEARARFDPEEMRDFLRKKTKFDADSIVPYVVFPFDVRHIYYESAGKLLNERRPDLWDNLQGNEFLIAVPEPRKVSEARPMFVSGLFDLHLHDRGCVGIPSQVAQEVEEASLFNGGKAKAHPPHANLAAEAWEIIKVDRKLKGGLDASDARSFARQLQRVCLALCHAPDYQAEHRESLAQDWAHIPIPKDRALFAEAVAAGDLLTKLLDPSADARKAIRGLVPKPEGLAVLIAYQPTSKFKLSDLVVTVPHFGGARGGWTPRPAKEGEELIEIAGERTGDLKINDEWYFSNVPEPVWLYELGGYPVLKKWLGYRDSKRRDGKPLTLAEKDHLREMIQRVSAIIALRPRLNDLYQRAILGAWTIKELGLE